MAKPKVTVPDVRGMQASEAINKLSQSSLGHKAIADSGEKDFVVSDQYPKPGERIPEGGTVFIYKQ